MACTFMCPPLEEGIRKSEKDVSRFEKRGLVKQYQRSSALLSKTAYDPLDSSNVRTLLTLSLAFLGVTQLKL